MSECKCDFRTYMVGDGCEVCNPAKALKYAKETIADQSEEIAILRAQLAASEARAERLESALTPRKWTKQQSHVWHCTIPDVDMAFEALRITALAEVEAG